MRHALALAAAAALFIAAPLSLAQPDGTPPPEPPPVTQPTPPPAEDSAAPPAVTPTPEAEQAEGRAACRTVKEPGEQCACLSNPDRLGVSAPAETGGHNVCRVPDEA